MALLISVAPAEAGWSVQSDVLAEAEVHSSGARAETAARALAARLAEAGRSAEVRIFLRDGAMAGRFLHPAGFESARLAG